MWAAYHELCHRLTIEPIPGHKLDKPLLSGELGRLLDLAQDAGIEVNDLIDRYSR